MEQTKKPEDQTVRLCLPQKKGPNLSNSAEAVLDFNLPMVSDRQMVGGASNRKWMWLPSPLTSTIRHLASKATERRLVNREARFSEVSI